MPEFSAVTLCVNTDRCYRCGILHFSLSIVLTKLKIFSVSREHLRRAYKNFREIGGDDDFGVAHCYYHMAAEDFREDALLDAE